MKKNDIARVLYYKLLPEDEWTQPERNYKTIKIGNAEIGTVELGHSFGNANSAKQLLRVLNYLDSDLVNKVYLRARKVE